MAMLVRSFDSSLAIVIVSMFFLAMKDRHAQAGVHDKSSFFTSSQPLPTSTENSSDNHDLYILTTNDLARCSQLSETLQLETDDMMVVYSHNENAGWFFKRTALLL